MKSSVIAIVSFGLGAAIGTGATYIYIKKKYAQTVNDEIEAIRAKYSGESYVNIPITESREVDDMKKEAEKAKNKPDINEYAKKLHESGYTNYSDNDVKKSLVEYISPEEFGEDVEYDNISLTYYSDGVLADDMDEVVEDFIDIVGNFTTHFGEYEDDVVYVRNDDKGAYYEIVRDVRRFKDVSEE